MARLAVLAVIAALSVAPAPAAAGSVIFKIDPALSQLYVISVSEFRFCRDASLGAAFDPERCKGWRAATAGVRFSQPGAFCAFVRWNGQKIHRGRVKVPTGTGEVQVWPIRPTSPPFLDC